MLPFAPVDVVHALLDVLPLALLGAVLGLDVVSFPQAMVSRPLVAATVAGAFVGQPGSGLIAGVVLELIALETLPPGGASMNGMNLSGKPGMVQPIQMPPTLGQPPMPCIQPRFGTLQLMTGPQHPILTWHFGEL